MPGGPGLAGPEGGWFAPVPRGGTVVLTRRSLAPLHEAFQRYGPFAIAVYLMATSRWGSYLPFGVPPFAADLVLGALLADRLLSSAAHRVRRNPVDLWLALTLAALLAWCVAEFLVSPWTFDALRDGAPYFYGVVAFLVLPSDERITDRLERLLFGGLIFHAAWVGFTLAFPSVTESLPSLGGGVPVLTTRNDFDGVVCGLLAALALHRAFSGRAVVWNLALAGISVVETLGLGSRAGLLGTAAMLATVGWMTRSRRDGARAQRRVALALVLLALPAAFAVVAQGKAVERLASSVSALVDAPTADYESAQGTAKARWRSWNVLADYLSTDSERMLVGVGYGPNFMVDSYADVELIGGGRDDVRSPHNYFMGSWARLGLIGLALILAVLLVGYRLVVLVQRNVAKPRDIDIAAMLVVVGMPIAASIGVVLESPFGAIPFFWALGHLSAICCARGVSAPFRLSPVRPATPLEGSP